MSFTFRIRCCWASFFGCLLWVSVALAGEKEPDRYAIVIGVNASDSEQTPALRYADDDAVLMHELFLEAGVKSTLLVDLDDDSRGFYQGVNIFGSPTRRELFRAFQSVQTKIDAQDELLLFYAGHGNVDGGEGYVVLADHGRLTRSDLYERILEPSRAARNHVFVDACKSYYLAFERGPGGTHVPYGERFIRGGTDSARARTGFVLSTSSARDSHEWDRFQAGVFSHELRSALRGSADVDRNGTLSYGEVAAFLEVANHSIRNPKYRPDFVVKAPSDLHDTALQWAPGSGVILMDAWELGHAYVEDALGARILDAHPRPGQVLALRVPKTRPLFVRAARAMVEYVITEPGDAALSRLATTTPSTTVRGALHLAFETLFQTPFGFQDVALYQKTHERLLSARLPSADSAPRVVQKIALVGAVSTAVLGGAFSLWALERRGAARSGTHERRVAVNRTIGTLNTTAVVLYATAAVAGLTWLGLKVWPDAQGPTLGVGPVAPAAPLGLHFQTTLP